MGSYVCCYCIDTQISIEMKFLISLSQMFTLQQQRERIPSQHKHSSYISLQILLKNASDAPKDFFECCSITRDRLLRVCTGTDCLLDGRRFTNIGSTMSTSSDIPSPASSSATASSNLIIDTRLISGVASSPRCSYSADTFKNLIHFLSTV